ncbi:MAG: hypothetical protein IT222_09620 [Crocinitomix sp.]|nr:hypothetical protein [Crocinitomix sp.]
MKKIILLASFLPILLSGCSGSGAGDEALAGDTTTIDFSDMNQITLEDNGLNMSLMLPEVASSTGASIDPKVEHDEGDYLWYLSIGPMFELIIEDYGKEKNKVASEKKRLADLSNIFTFEFLVDEPKLIMYRRSLHEGQGGKTTFHCYGEVEVEGYNYVLRSAEEGSLKPIIEDMVKTIRSAKPIANS